MSGLRREEWVFASRDIAAIEGGRRMGDEEMVVVMRVRRTVVSGRTESGGGCCCWGGGMLKSFKVTGMLSVAEERLEEEWRAREGIFGLLDECRRWEMTRDRLARMMITGGFVRRGRVARDLEAIVTVAGIVGELIGENYGTWRAWHVDTEEDSAFALNTTR